MIRTYRNFDNSAGTWPLSLSDAKAYLRVSHSDDDDMIKDIINEASFYAQEVCNQQLIDSFSAKVIARQSELENERSVLIPLYYKNSTITITSITLDGTALTADDYTLRSDNVLKLDSEPAVGVEVVIEYDAEVAQTVNVNNAIKKLVADAYENRTEQGIESLFDIKMNARKYLHQYINGSDLF